jgi:hypothetical protein
VKKAVQKGFINEVSEDEIVCDLNALESSPLYLTRSVHRYNSDKWPNNEMPFVDFHLGYLRSHPSLDPKQYIANLRLVLRSAPR